MRKVLGVTEMEVIEMVLEFDGIHPYFAWILRLHIEEGCNCKESWTLTNWRWEWHDAFQMGTILYFYWTASVQYDPFCLQGYQTLDFVTLWSSIIHSSSCSDSPKHRNCWVRAYRKSFQMPFLPSPSFFLRPKA